VFRIPLVPIFLILVTVIAPLNAVANGAGTPRAPQNLIRRYVYDIARHQYRSAARLEATCTATVRQHFDHNPFMSTTELPARGTVSSAAKALIFVRSADVKSIGPFQAPVLRQSHLFGFHVAGWFHFVYPSYWVGNNERPSGFHRITLIVRSCAGRLMVDPGWPGTGGGALGWR